MLAIPRANMIKFETSELIIGQRMARVVPASEAQVDATDKGHHVVYDNGLLVVGPEELILSELVWRALNDDIWM